jgi:hypothetical protein
MSGDLPPTAITPISTRVTTRYQGSTDPGPAGAPIALQSICDAVPFLPGADGMADP